MYTVSHYLLLVHLIGVALALGAATIKLNLVYKGSIHPELFSSYFRLVKPITRLLILGMILLTLSGIGFIIIGTSLSTLLIIKMVLVLFMWILGPVIDNVFEPRLHKLVMDQANVMSASFVHAQKQYLLIEIFATAIIYVITIIGVIL